MAESTNTSNAGGDNGIENPENDGAASTATAEKKTKVVFTDEQQEWLETWGNSMFGKGRAKAETEIKSQYESQVATLNTQLADLKSQLEAATKAKSEATTKEGKSQATEDVAQIKAQLEEMTENLKALRTERDTFKTDRDRVASELETLRGRDKESRRASEFREAASGLNFIDVDEVYALVREQLSEDENGNFVVMNPKTGRPRINKEGEPMSLGEHLASFAAQKPHLVKASGAAGSGTGAGPSRGSQNQSTSGAKNSLGVSVEEIDKMTPAEFEAHKAQLMAGRRRR